MTMEKITKDGSLPTAEEWLSINYEANIINPNILIEFAKLHVEAALKAAYENIEYFDTTDNSFPMVEENSILNAYPLTNIK